jgi:hypothetical protein
MALAERGGSPDSSPDSERKRILSMAFDMIRILAVIALASGCTTYGPAGFAGGYSEQQINARAWRVSCAGNGYSSLSFTKSCATRRAAELAFMHGFVGFVVADSGDDVSVYTTPSRVECNGNSIGTQRYVSCNEHGGQRVAKPSSDMTIVFMNAEEAPLAVAAGRVVYDVGLTLGRPASIPSPAAAVAPQPAIALCSDRLQDGRYVVVSCWIKSAGKQANTQLIDKELTTAATAALANGKPYLISVGFEPQFLEGETRLVATFELLTLEQAQARANPLLPRDRLPMAAANILQPTPSAEGNPK